MQAVQSPVIPHIAALIRENPGAISLGQGVVHYPPPPQAMQEAARFGETIAEHHYQAARGLPELQEALRKKLAAENQIQVSWKITFSPRKLKKLTPSSLVHTAKRHNVRPGSNALKTQKLLT